MLTVYVLKNGVGRYNIFFFNFYTKLAESSFLCRFRVEFVNVLFFHDSIWAHFLHQQTISHICANAFPNEFIVRSYEYCADIEFFTGCKKIKQRRISFILGYLRMILWKISTAFSIKHRILATFSINKKINSDSLYAFN
jgi:hypothetical protein